MTSILTKAALAIGFAAALSANAAAEPALFEARDADTTIYLFGTIHAVPCAATHATPGAGTCRPWMTGVVEAAFAAADELWLEPTPDDGKFEALMLQYGYLEGTRLTEHMPEADLRVAAELIGGPMADAILPQLDAMQPWLVTMLFAEAGFAAGGVSFENGVDYTLMRLAGERGMTVNGFETAEEQLRVLSADPFALQVADLRSLAMMPAYGVDPATFMAWMFEKLWEIWATGDLEQLAALLLADDEEFFQRYGAELGPLFGLDDARMTALIAAMDALYVGLADSAQRAIDTHETLIVARNNTWMTDIRAMLDRPGTFFVAVGAGHLVGGDGLPTLLGREGAVVTRLQ